MYNQAYHQFNEGMPLWQFQGNQSMNFPPATPMPPAPQQNVMGDMDQLPMEQSYIENILRLNKGKLATVYMSFDGEAGKSPMVFTGIIEAAGRDHIILSDPETGMRYLLLMVYLNYVTFNEEIEYRYPGMANYSPR